MSDHIQSLIRQLIAAGKAQGLTQEQLAKQAGITPVGLSKAKARGDLLASTLEELGSQLDLELAFVPRQSKEKAIAHIKAGAFFGARPEVDVK